MLNSQLCIIHCAFLKYKVTFFSAFFKLYCQKYSFSAFFFFFVIHKSLFFYAFLGNPFLFIHFLTKIHHILTFINISITD